MRRHGWDKCADKTGKLVPHGGAARGASVRRRGWDAKGIGQSPQILEPPCREAFLKPCLPVRRQGAVKTATTCRFLLEAPPQSDVGRSGTGHGQTKVLNLEARTQPECARTEFQSKPLGFYHEHVWQSHLRHHRASSRSPPPRFRRQRCPVEGRRSKERVGLPLRIAPLRSSDAAGICEHGI